MLTPSGDTVLESGDRIVFLADSYEDCEPSAKPVVDAAPDASRTNRGKEAMSDHNVLIVGWNHKIPTLLEALDHRSSEHFRVTILSSLSREAREQDIQRDGITLSRIEMVYHQADTTVQTAYDEVEPARYDSILFAASDRFQSGEESDATTILRYLVMMEVVGERPRPKILVELMDPENVSLLPEGVESIVSPVLLSHMLAQVALRLELHTVFGHLFGPEGADISLSPASRYGVAGKELTFGALQDLLFAGDETVMGLRRDGTIMLDPDRSQTVQIRDTDELILLTNF
jgi:Trk K+ transport system NAD-binding subunit